MSTLSIYLFSKMYSIKYSRTLRLSVLGDTMKWRTPLAFSATLSDFHPQGFFPRPSQGPCLICRINHNFLFSHHHLSYSMMFASLWATVMMVVRCRSSSSSLCTRASLLLSMALVASSRIRILEIFYLIPMNHPRWLTRFNLKSPAWIMFNVLFYTK